MSRKQKLYRMLLQKGILQIRSHQSQLAFPPWWRVPPWKLHKFAGTSYEISQFLHQVPMLMANEEFTEGDLWFLNNHARSFFARAEPRLSFLYTYFMPPTRQLFQLVPEGMREQLEWPGPEPPELTLSQRAEWNESLFEATENSEDIEALLDLLSWGIDPNVRNMNGKTPLQTALLSGKTEYVQVLRDAGARE